MKLFLITGTMERRRSFDSDIQIVNDIYMGESEEAALGWSLDLEQKKFPDHAARAFRAQDITQVARQFCAQHPEPSPGPPAPPPPTRPMQG